MNNLLKYISSYEYDLIKSNTNKYDAAYMLVSILFKDINDQSGKPYIGHLIRVSDKLDGNARVAGLLHDVIEDINGITEDDLLDIGFDKNIIDIVSLVTNKNMDYHEFITSIINSGNIDAIRVKYSDMSDNYNPDRLKDVSSERREHLINKYKDEIVRLKEELERREVK